MNPWSFFFIGYVFSQPLFYSPDNIALQKIFIEIR